VSCRGSADSVCLSYSHPSFPIGIGNNPKPQKKRLWVTWNKWDSYSDDGAPAHLTRFSWDSFTYLSPERGRLLMSFGKFSLPSYSITIFPFFYIFIFNSIDLWVRAKSIRAVVCWADTSPVLKWKRQVKDAMVCLITLVSFYIFSLSIPLWNFGIGMILNSDHDFSRSRTRPSVTTCRRRAIDFWNDDNLHRPVFFFFHSKNKIKQRVTNSFDDFFPETKLQLGITIG
jgi:hypothetical protein